MDTLKEVGRTFGRTKYSSVGSAIERLKDEMSRNRGLRKLVVELERQLSKNQEQI